MTTARFTLTTARFTLTTAKITMEMAETSATLDSALFLFDLRELTAKTKAESVKPSAFVVSHPIMIV
jgi:hypothetical protein